MRERYIRNIPAISEEEQKLLADKSVFIVGCGGLGGYIVEELARLGVGHIEVADGDIFNESNLNRQLFSSVDKIGISKIHVAAERISKVNPDIEFVGYDKYLPAKLIAEAIEDCDLVLDALDSIEDRLTLEDLCDKAGLPLVHGAVKGWNLQVSVSTPGNRVLHKIYMNNEADGKSENTEKQEEKTCLCPTPAICASMQVIEALKLLIGHESTLSGKLFCLDLKSMESYTINI